MSKRKLTNELNDIIQYIEKNVYPFSNSAIAFTIAVLENEDSIAFKILSKKLFESQIDEIKEECNELLSKAFSNVGTEIIPKELLTENDTSLNSGDVLYYFLRESEYDHIKQLFKKFGVTSNRIKEDVESYHQNENKTVEKHKKKITKSSTKNNSSNVNKADNELEVLMNNINLQSNEGKITNIVGNEEVYENIFNVLLKKDNNNVVLVGENGVGKTSIVKNIANLITKNTVPKHFKNKILMEIDYHTLLSGAMFKGALETKIKNIIEIAKRYSKYIFFIDDLDFLLSSTKKNNDDGAENLIKKILDENKINLIATMTPKGYSKLCSDYPNICIKFNKINIDEPNEKEAIDILENIKENYELYHNVIYTNEAVEKCVKLSKRYLSEFKLPSVAIDVLDEAAANILLKETESETLSDLKAKLQKIQDEKEIINNGTHKDYDAIDKLARNEINIKSLIKLEEKNILLTKEPVVIQPSDIENIISKRTGIPLQKITINDKENLKKIDDVLKSVVIGQDSAIEEVCRTIKRQRVGLSNKNKPVVLMFTGSTGTGKTYLTKKIAELIFGDEKYLVRLDMSEYSDKMSASKLIGSSAGYIGYDDGGILTEAIKKNKYCVLLLDECEKADDSVFNMFLQVFDEGRLKDNKGVEIDFKNVIIVLTSNVGAQEASECNGGIGFKTLSSIEDYERGVYEKAIKRKFKPEFINRIDKIIYFNKLSNDNLKKIVNLEIKKINDRLQSMGYYLNDDVYEPMVDVVINEIEEHKNYGARPILRVLQRKLEDKIADILINNDIEIGHTFTYKEIFE